MESFDTICSKCKKQLALSDAWPPGVTVIGFGRRGRLRNRRRVGIRVFLMRIISTFWRCLFEAGFEVLLDIIYTYSWGN